MHNLYVNVLNETEKLWKRRRTKAFLALTLLVPVIFAVLLAFLQNRTGIFGGFASSLPMLTLGLFTFALLPMFLFMTAADLFTGEEEARTLKLTLVRPITRTKVFASKVAAIAFCIAVLLGALWVVSVMSGLLVPGDNITEALSDSTKAYTAAFLPMMAIGLIAVLIALCFKNATGAMATIVFIYVAAKLVPLVFPQFSIWSVFSYTDWHVLWVGNGASAVKLLHSFVLLFSYCIIAYTAGWVMFERKSL